MGKPKFEKFRRYKVTEGDDPIVSIHVRGIFALNKNAYDKLGEPEAIEMMYASEDRIIGFSAAPKSSPDSYAVRHNTKTAFQVEGRAFLNYYGISDDAGRRYVAEMMDEILIVQLDQESID